MKGWGHNHTLRYRFLKAFAAEEYLTCQLRGINPTRWQRYAIVDMVEYR